MSERTNYTVVEGQLDAVGILMHDRDEWKRRALAAEAETKRWHELFCAADAKLEERAEWKRRALEAENTLVWQRRNRLVAIHLRNGVYLEDAERMARNEIPDRV